MTRKVYDCKVCGTFEYEHKSINDNNLNKCPNCGNEVTYNMVKTLKDSLAFNLPAFNDIEVNKPEWKKKGKRWTQEHKIKGL